jgi:hypothetical protein
LGLNGCALVLHFTQFLDLGCPKEEMTSGEVALCYRADLDRADLWLHSLQLCSKSFPEGTSEWCNSRSSTSSGKLAPAYRSSWEPWATLPNHSQRWHLGILKMAIMGAFIPQKLANATNQEFFFPTELLFNQDSLNVVHKWLNYLSSLHLTLLVYKMG